MMGVSTVMMAPLYAWEIVVQGRTFALDQGNLLIIGYTALFPSVLGYICWSNAIKVLGPNTAALSQYLSPVFGIFLAVVILGESVEAFHMAGIVLVLAGVFLAGRRGME
jgi:drug/metabolite transporter (DMT)-like permease